MSPLQVYLDKSGPEQSSLFRKCSVVKECPPLVLYHTVATSRLLGTGDVGRAYLISI